MNKLLCWLGIHYWGFSVDDIIANQNSHESPYFCVHCQKRLRP